MWAAGVMLVLVATHQPPFFTDGTPNAITKLHKSWVRKFMYKMLLRIYTFIPCCMNCVDRMLKSLTAC